MGGVHAACTTPTSSSPPVVWAARSSASASATLISSSPRASAHADDQVDVLLDEGWDPGHVALLTTGRRHPVQIERQDELGQRGYWDTFWDHEDVFYGHVLGAKGMERRAVVLCINESGHTDRFRERLYVGLSRATDRLVVVGDLEVIARAEAGRREHVPRATGREHVGDDEA